MSSSSHSSGSIGLPGLLFVVFVTLKLCGVIAWSWWWVTAPLWIGFAAVFVVAFAVFVLTQIAEQRRPRRRH